MASAPVLKLEYFSLIEASSSLLLVFGLAAIPLTIHRPTFQSSIHHHDHSETQHRFIKIP